MKEIYSFRKIDRMDFILAERIELKKGGYIEAQTAAAVYRAEGWYVRVERDDENLCYYIWVGPERIRKVGLLPREKVAKRAKIRKLRAS